jgi:hypothetical protein
MTFLERYNAIRQYLIDNSYYDVKIAYPKIWGRQISSKKLMHICTLDYDYEIDEDHTNLKIKEYLEKLEKLKVFE